jgi:hypothetical protein
MKQRRSEPVVWRKREWGQDDLGGKMVERNLEEGRIMERVKVCEREERAERKKEEKRRRGSIRRT